MEMDNRMSIIVISCDKYRDIVEYYLYYLKLNWKDCKYRILVAEQECDLHSDVAETVLCGKDVTWTKAAINTISQTKSPFILLSCDDFYIFDKVYSDEIEEVLDFIEKNKIKYYRLPISKPYNRKYIQYKDNRNVEMIPRNKAYGVSIGTSIWDRNEILNILGDGSKTAWDLENEFSKNAADSKEAYYVDYVSDRRPLLHSVHMATMGKWIPSAVKKFKKHGYNDIEYQKRGFVSNLGILKMRFYFYSTLIVPTKLRKPIKAILSKAGFRFATKW